MKKKIIIFSPNGYIGGYIKKRMQQEKEIQLFELTRDSNLENYTDNYDTMIYTAAITSARQETVEKYIQDNVVAAVAMVNFCNNHKIRRIIYLSSDEIYGEINTDMVTEKAVMVNPGLYAATKYLAEKIIIESGIPYFILRLPGVVGKVWGNNFIYRLMNNIRRNETIKLYNADRLFNNIVHIEDLASFMVLLCYYKDSNKNEVLLLGNIQRVTLWEVVHYIKNLYQSESKIENINTDTGRCFSLDVKKAVEYGYNSKKITSIFDDLYRIQKG